MPERRTFTHALAAVRGSRFSEPFFLPPLTLSSSLLPSPNGGPTKTLRGRPNDRGAQEDRDAFNFNLSTAGDVGPRLDLTKRPYYFFFSSAYEGEKATVTSSPDDVTRFSLFLITSEHAGPPPSSSSNAAVEATTTERERDRGSGKQAACVGPQDCLSARLLLGKYSNARRARCSS